MSEFRESLINQNTFSAFMSKVFMVMALGLGVSFVTALIVYQSSYAVFAMLHPYLLIILQLATAFLFTYSLFKLSKPIAWACYIFYCVITGLSLSILPLVYEGDSILFAIASTMVLFICLAFIGHNTKIDLSRYSTYFFIGLIAVIIITIVNTFFIKSSTMDLFLTYVGVIIFLGITAYDIQKLRKLYLHGYGDENLYDKLVIYGAFELYLDFINLFVRILRIIGKQRKN